MKCMTFKLRKYYKKDEVMMVKCKSKSCKREGTNPVEYNRFGKIVTEYYCDSHYRDVNILLNLFEAVNKQEG